MSVAAAVATFRREFVLGYEVRKSDLTIAATKETMSNGLTVTWAVSSTGGEEAVTRGSNGLIPYTVGDTTQVTATLVEKHAAHKMTGFNVFASQGDQKKKLQDDAMAKIKRAQDNAILTELANSTQDYGTGTLSHATVEGALAILGNNDVPVEDEAAMFGVLSPAARGYLRQIGAFSSADYVDIKPLVGPVRKMIRWAGVNWIVSSLVSGKGTNAEQLYIWHKDALGYASNLGEDKMFAGYNEEQGYSFARAELYHVAKILQNSGIINITHDGSAYVAS